MLETSGISNVWGQAVAQTCLFRSSLALRDHNTLKDSDRDDRFGGAVLLRYSHTIGVGLTASLINPVAFSYGYDRLRFVRPVHIGDTTCTRATISAKENNPTRARSDRVIEPCEVLNQRDEIVLAVDHILIVERN